jgi:hypothetical protein
VFVPANWQSQDEADSMAFEPDILITTPDGITLVVEANTALRDLEGAEKDLKQYMAGMQCLVGLPIMPKRMWLYRDFYTARSLLSVKRVGEFNARAILAAAGAIAGSGVRRFVQRGLEDSPGSPGIRRASRCGWRSESGRSALRVRKTGRAGRVRTLCA